jgi:hypothetical protein
MGVKCLDLYLNKYDLETIQGKLRYWIKWKINA